MKAIRLMARQVDPDLDHRLGVGRVAGPCAAFEGELRL
jgi:hypothetical protein